ncbi:MAG: hypothetical protein M3O87_06345 [Candidatus Dormibacteraeota bacterium]|nr:hypothetical protein [Candidatus Dormibacteraeota bacterium]
MAAGNPALTPLPLSLRPDSRLTLEVPWPRHPVVTKTGRLSKAKDAGKPIPWLSRNVVHNLTTNPMSDNPRAMLGQVQRYKVAWKEAVTEAIAEDDGEVLQLQHHVEIEAVLYRNPANAMDPGGITEGLKPLVDALVEGGVLRGDTSTHVSYSPRSRVVTTPRGTQRVVLYLRRPA